MDITFSAAHEGSTFDMTVEQDPSDGWLLQTFWFGPEPAPGSSEIRLWRMNECRAYSSDLNEVMDVFRSILAEPPPLTAEAWAAHRAS